MMSLCFAGQRSADFGLVVTGSGTYNAPERDMEAVAVEGRSGDLILDKGRYKNIPVSYPVSICRDFPEKAHAARSWLLSKPGYRRLEDDYNPDYFRMGMFQGPLDFSVKFLGRAAEATLTFNCKPQRYLKSGEHPFTLQAAGRLWNPTGFPALPRIAVYGSGAGELTVGGSIVKILAMTDHLILDSESQNAFRVTAAGTQESRNGDIYAPVFPVLTEGEIPVSWSGGITHIEIIPRWWTI